MIIRTEGVFGIWLRLYEEYPQSAESLEARWRIAEKMGGAWEDLQRRDNLLAEAQKMLKEKLSQADIEQKQTDNIFSLFRSPADTVMTAFKLTELQVRIFQLQQLCGPENLKGDQRSADRLAKFVMLNPHSRQYAGQLEELLQANKRKDGFYDNLLLAQTMLIPDDQLRMEQLADLHTKYSKTDGGMQAFYELGMLKKRLWLQEQQSGSEQKKKLLSETKDILSSFLNLYPDSFYAESVKKILAGLPKAE